MGVKETFHLEVVNEKISESEDCKSMSGKREMAGKVLRKVRKRRRVAYRIIPKKTTNLIRPPVLTKSGKRC